MGWDRLEGHDWEHSLLGLPVVQWGMVCEASHTSLGNRSDP